MAFNEQKYRDIFEQRYGKGSFNAGLSSARQLGQLKVQASQAKEDYFARLKEQEKAAREAEKAAKKKGYSEALQFWSSPENKKALRSKGAEAAVIDIENDPLKQEQIKAEGYSLKEYKDAMYAAASDGKFRSKKEYESFRKNLTSETNKKNKARDKEYQDKYGMSYDEYYETQKELEKQKAKESKAKKEKKKKRTFLEDLGLATKSAAQAFNPFDSVSAEEALDNWMKKDKSKVFKETARQSSRVVNRFSLGTMSALDKKVNNKDSIYYLTKRPFNKGGALDMASDLVGYLLPGAGAVKVARGLGLGAKAGAKGVKKLGQLALEGAVTGAGLTGLEQGIKGAITPEDFNLKEAGKDLALNTILGAVADPIVDTALGKVLTKLKKGKSVKQVAKEENIPEEKIRKVVQGTLDGQEVIDPNTLRLNPPSKDTPLLTNEPLQLGVTRRPSGLGKEVTINGTPLLDSPRFTTPKPEEMDTILADMQNAFRRRQLEEDSFVNQRMEPFNTMMSKSADAEVRFQEEAKNMQELAQNIQKQYGKIYIPRENQADWFDAVPARFRANKDGSNAGGYDIYKFADEEGFSSVDEAIQFLQTVDSGFSVKKKDLKPQDHMNIKDDQYSSLEDAARQEFNNTDTARGLDGYFNTLNDMVKSGKANEGDPLRFVQSKLFKNEPDGQSFTRKIDPKDQVAVKSEGEFSTRYTESPSGDTLKINAKKPTEQGFKRTIEKEITRKDIAEVDSRNTNLKKATLNGETPNPSSKGSVLGAMATSNGRTFTPMDKAVDVMGRMKKTMSKTKKESKLKKSYNAFAENMIDDLARLKSVENELRGKHRLASVGRAYRFFSTAKGAPASADYMLKEKVLPIFKNVSEKGGNVEDAFKYRLAKHLKEVVEHNPDYILPSDLTIKDLDDTISTFKGNEIYENFNKEIEGVFKAVRDVLVDSGRISKKQAEEMEKLYPNYLPKYREKDLDPNTFEQAFFNDFQSISAKSPIKGLKEGSTEPIKDFVENMSMYIGKSMQSAANNKALRELGELAKLDKDGKWISFDKSKKGTPISYFDNGKEVTVYVDKPLAEALSQATHFEKDSMTGFVKGLSKMQRLSITGTPAFTIRNLMRDIPQGYAYSKAGMKVSDIWGAALDIFTHGKGVKKSDLEDFYKHGAGMTTVWSRDSKQFRTYQQQAYKEYKKGFKDVNMNNPKELKEKVGGLLDWYRENVLGKTEELMKLAEFKAAKRNGSDNDEAAYFARDMLDFFKSGKSVRRVNPYVSFLNTTIQGRSKFLRSFTEAAADGDKKKLLQLAYRNAMVAATPTMLSLWAYNTFATDKQKKTMDEAPDYLRDTYWLFPMKNGKDLLRIPKPFESAALVSTPMEHFIRKNKGLNDDTQAEVQKWIMDNVLYDPSLTPITPFIELATGVDLFNKSTIEPQREKGKKKIEKTDVYISNTADNIAKVFDKIGLGNTNFASPRHIDNLIEGYLPTANAGQHVDKVLDTLGIQDKKEVPKKEGLPDNLLTNIGKQFVVKDEGRTTPLMGKAYDTQEKLQAKGGLDPQAKMDYKRLNRVLKGKGGVNDISKAIRKIANDPKLSGREKQKQMNPLIERRNELIRQLESEGIFERNR